MYWIHTDWPIHPVPSTDELEAQVRQYIGGLTTDDYERNVGRHMEHVQESFDYAMNFLRNLQDCTMPIAWYRTQIRKVRILARELRATQRIRDSFDDARYESMVACWMD